MTGTLTEIESEVETMATGTAHHTNVFVVIAYGQTPFVREIFGPFRNPNAAKDWGLANEQNFAIAEIMRPLDVEDIGFVITDPHHEPTLEDQGIHEKQAVIGDYIDPDILRK